MFSNTCSCGAELFHSCHEVVHVLVHYRLQRSRESSAESRSNLLRNLAMANWILCEVWVQKSVAFACHIILSLLTFPHKTTEVLAAILEVSLDKVLQILVLRCVNVGERLRREESKFIRCDADN